MGVPPAEPAACPPSPPDSRTSRSRSPGPRRGVVGASDHAAAPQMASAVSLDHLSDLESSPEPLTSAAPRPVGSAPSRGATLEQAISLDSDESSDDDVILVPFPAPRSAVAPFDALAPEADVKPTFVASPPPIERSPPPAPQADAAPLQGSSKRPLTCSACRRSDSAIWLDNGDGRPICQSCSASQSPPDMRSAPAVAGPSKRRAGGQKTMARKSMNRNAPPRKMAHVSPTPSAPPVPPAAVDDAPSTTSEAPRLPSPARSSPERPLSAVPKRPRGSAASTDESRPAKRARTEGAGAARIDLLAHADRRPPSPPPLPTGLILPEDWTLGARMIVPGEASRPGVSAKRALGKTSSAASISGGGTKQRFLLARSSSVAHKRTRSSSIVGAPSTSVAPTPPATFVQQREEAWEDALEARITPHRRVYAPDADDPTADPWIEGVTSHDHEDRPAPKNAFVRPDRFRYGYPVIRNPAQLRVAARPLDDILPLFDPAEPKAQHRTVPRPSVVTWAQFELAHAAKTDKVVATATAEAALGHGPPTTASASAVGETPAQAASAALVAASTAAANACG